MAKRSRLKYRLIHLCVLMALCAGGAKLVSLIDWSSPGSPTGLLWLGGGLLAAAVTSGVLYLLWGDYFSRSPKSPVPPELPSMQPDEQESDEQKEKKIRFKMRRDQQSGFKW